MDFKTFLDIAPMVAADRRPIMLRGRHGIGKSCIVYDMVNRLAYNPADNTVVVIPAGGEIPEGCVRYGIVERRASQMTEGEMTGLPSIAESVTRWNPPDWFQACVENPMILFMDEVDRGVLEVRQSFFELTDSRKVYGNVLHPGTLIFAAVNGGIHGAQYTVAEMDPAELDRWTVFDIDPTDEDWLSWANDHCHRVIYDFINNNRLHLEKNKGELQPNKVYPSRRSWDRLSSTLSRAGCLDAPKEHLTAIYFAATGFVGEEAAIAFRDFCGTIESQVQPEDLIDKGQFAKIKDWQQPQHAAMILKIRDSGALDRILTPKQIKNLQKYFKILPGELAMTLHSYFLERAQVAKEALKDTPNIEETIMKQVATFHGGIKDEVVRLITGGVQKVDLDNPGSEEAKAETPA